MATLPDKDAQHRDKPLLPWIEVPELRQAWFKAVGEADEAARKAGVAHADLALAHLDLAATLVGYKSAWAWLDDLALKRATGHSS